jgi:hypothetical protein
LSDFEKDVLYKEYVRRAKYIESLMHGSFDDFKLFGIIGAILAWKPIVDSISATAGASGTGSASEAVLVSGFAAFAGVFYGIGARDLIKRSLIGRA